MKDNDKTPHISEYKTAIPGWKPVGDKYQGVIGCSMTASATDPSYHEFITDELYSTKEEAMRAAADLHHKLATEREQDQD